MTTAVHVERPAGALALNPTQQDWTAPQRAALVQLGLEDVPGPDLQVFLHQAQRTGLDPFARQIYMIGRWDSRAGRNKYTIQSSIDGLRVVAERHGQYGGQVGPEWCGADGKWTDVWVSDKPPVASRVGVVRKDWTQPCYAVAKFSEYAAKKRDGALEPMWASKSCVMISKCAEALALRKAFPHDLSGIYTSEEMAQADAPPLQVVIDQDAEETKRDWEVDIKACAGDRDKLKALWKEARAEGDAEAEQRINKAAAALPPVKAAKEAATAHPAEAVEVVEGEVVEDPPKLQAQADIPDLLEALVHSGEVGTVAGALNTVKQRTALAHKDVSGLLIGEFAPAAIELGLERAQKITLLDFAAKVLAYVETNGYSVSNGADLAAEQEKAAS